ncbi:MAG: hypothetical protein QGG40_22160, partial [Myxococcota bacterium]|nr:hypothetical protein [Myxococcota bacterium]
SYMPGPIEANAFFAALELVTYGSEYGSEAWSEDTEFTWWTGVGELRDMGYAYLALHPQFLDPDQKERIQGWLEGRIRMLETYSDGTVLYEVRGPSG